MDESRVESLFQRAVILGAEERRRLLDAEAPRGTDDRRHVDSLLGHVASAPAAFLGGQDEVTTRERPGGPDRIGPYLLLKEIGRGGQGIVWLARDTDLGRDVALKVLPGLGPGSEEIVARFRREALITSRLRHSGLCTIYDAATENGVPYIAMQFIDGEPLSVRIAADRTPPAEGNGPAPGAAGAARPAPARVRLAAKLEMIEAVARALHAAHEAGVIHRDIKPGNIMVRADGGPVLMDFGLARSDDDAGATLTRAGDLLGTPAYLPPESIARTGARSDRRSDVWSLGVTLYETVTGERPFSAPTREGLYRAILGDDPPDVRRLEPAAGADLNVVIATALEKEPDRRYQTTLALAEDLRRVREHEPILARPIGVAGRLRRWIERKPAVAASLGAVLVILAAGLGVALHLLARARDSETAALASAGRARREAVRASYAAAVHALASFDSLAARIQIEAASGDDPGFEWRHLAWIADRSEKTLPCAEPLSRLVFIPGGHEFLTVTDGGRVSLWDANSGDRRDLPLDAATGRRIRAFDPDVRRAALVDPPALVDLSSGQELWRREDAGPSGPVAFSGDGRSLAVLSRSESRVTFLDAEDGGDAGGWPLPIPIFGRDHFTLSVGASHLLVSDLGESWAHDLGSGEVAWKSGHASTVLIDRDGRLAANLHGPSLRITSGETGELLWSAESPANRTVMAVTASSDGSLVASGEATGAVILRGAGDGAIRSVLLGHTSEVDLLSFSSDGRWLLSHSRDGTIKLWRTGRGEDVPFIPAEERLGGGLIAPRRGLVAAAGWGFVELRNALTGRLLWTASPSRTWIRAMAFSPAEDRLAVSGDDGRIHVLDLEGRELPALSGSMSGRVVSLAWTPEAAVIAGCDDGTIWAADGSGLLVSKARGDAPVRRLVMDPVRQVLAASCGAAPAGGEGSAAARPLDLWDLASWTRIPTAIGRGSSVQDLAFSKDGRRLATVGDEGRACLWDLRTHQLLAETGFPHRRISGVAFGPGDTRVALACDDGALHLWDLDDVPRIILNRGAESSGTVDVDWVGDSVVLLTGQGIRLYEVRPPPAICEERMRMNAARETVQVLRQTAVLTDDVINRLEQDAGLPSPLRADAIAYARAHGDRPSRLNSMAWDRVRGPGATVEQLSMALRAGEAAARRFPDDAAILNTVGVALFRLGRHADALAALERSDRLNRESGRGSHPIDLLVMAMANAGRGELERGSVLLRAAEKLAEDPRYSADLEVSSFHREAKVLFADH